MSIFGMGELHPTPSASLLTRIAAFCLGWFLVETIDFDGERRIRRLYQDDRGRFWCRGIHDWRQLLPGGKFAENDYMTAWRFLDPERMKHLPTEVLSRCDAR